MVNKKKRKKAKQKRKIKRKRMVRPKKKPELRGLTPSRKGIPRVPFPSKQQKKVEELQAEVRILKTQRGELQKERLKELSARVRKPFVKAGRGIERVRRTRIVRAAEDVGQIVGSIAPPPGRGPARMPMRPLKKKKRGGFSIFGDEEEGGGGEGGFSIF